MYYVCALQGSGDELLAACTDRLEYDFNLYACGPGLRVVKRDEAYVTLVNLFGRQCTCYLLRAKRWEERQGDVIQGGVSCHSVKHYICLK